jgi:hypothetical protein
LHESSQHALKRNVTFRHSGRMSDWFQKHQESALLHVSGLGIPCVVRGRDRFFSPSIHHFLFSSRKRLSRIQDPNDQSSRKYRSSRVEEEKEPSASTGFHKQAFSYYQPWMPARIVARSRSSSVDNHDCPSTHPS